MRSTEETSTNTCLPKLVLRRREFGRAPVRSSFDGVSYSPLSRLTFTKTTALFCCCAIVTWPQVEVSRDVQDASPRGAVAAVACRNEGRPDYPFREWPRQLVGSLSLVPHLRSIGWNLDPLTRAHLPRIQAGRPVGRASSRKRRQFFDARRQLDPGGKSPGRH